MSQTKFIDRPEYLSKLSLWKDKDMIKVVTGIRRAGKSVLLQLFIEKLKSEGVNEDQIIYLNFEDLSIATEEIDNYKKLHDYITSLTTDVDKKYYVFLDEIQIIEDFERAVDSLYIKPNIDLYITGSNAYMFSGELATLLSGRYIEINVLPLSFKEYASYFNRPADEKLYLDYVTRSSFPYTVNFETYEEAADYLEGIYTTVLIKDVAKRKKLVDSSTLRDVAKYLYSSLGTPLSVKNIANALTAGGRSTSPHTVESYLDALVEGQLFYKAERYDIRGKQILQSNSKYYAADVAMRSVELGRRDMDAGRMLENVVYLELIRRGYKVMTGRAGGGEVDFFAQKNSDSLYIQVAYTAREESTLNRELASLKAIPDHYPKLLLTMDVDPESSYDGIQKMNVLDWLMKD